MQVLTCITEDIARILCRNFYVQLRTWSVRVCLDFYGGPEDMECMENINSF